MIKGYSTLTGNTFPLRILFFIKEQKGADCLLRRCECCWCDIFLWGRIQWKPRGKHTHTAQIHAHKHTLTGDHIKLRALGLAEPPSHNRNLRALLTSVSMPVNSEKRLLRTSGPTLSHLKRAGSDSELKWICVAESAWLSHPKCTALFWCKQDVYKLVLPL